jgi:hypothetical protein
VLLGIRLLEQAVAILRGTAKGFELADEVAEALHEQRAGAPDVHEREAERASAARPTR